MPNNNFNGKTFVAFIDISGFKNMMKQQQAREALTEFYSIGYRALSEHQDIGGVFISDCGILYHSNSDTTIENKLTQILDVVKIINANMIKKNYLLTTSIAYGDFEYRNKIELENMTKNPFHGNAYLEAYLDNEKGTPKLKAGECRILISDDIKELILNNQDIKKTSKHFYYYWMLKQGQSIEEYEQSINTIEKNYTKKFENLNDEKFENLKQLLRGQR